MKKYVIIATKGRAVETATLFDFLYQQEARPDAVYVVGAESADLPQVAGHPLHAHTRIKLMLSKAPGLTVQRNVGVAQLLRDLDDENMREPWFAAFFDDDFRPHRAWLAKCAALFSEAPGVIGMTGQVLADGVRNKGISEADALKYLRGEFTRQQHWASGDERRLLNSAYGCNMAFVERVIRTCKFDEALPLYGWQEDQDYTSQALKLGLGEFLYEPACIGVHLGVKGGRISGVRFGYSQIANPIFLMKKNTMERRKAYRFITRHLLSNVYHSLRRDPVFDYRGRLKGNVLAFVDFVRGSSHPQRILDIGIAARGRR
jgi:GT2 family glycosyltransferase